MKILGRIVLWIVAVLGLLLVVPMIVIAFAGSAVADWIESLMADHSR